MDNKWTYDSLRANILFYIDSCHVEKRFDNFDEDVAKLTDDDGPEVHGDSQSPKQGCLIETWFMKQVDKPSSDELKNQDAKLVEVFYCKNYILPSMILSGNHTISLPESTLNMMSLDWLEGKVVYNNTLQCFEVIQNLKRHILEIKDQMLIE